MDRPFDSFVVFAEMRTGSNFLETNLNAFAGITCHGEAFNPHFIGYPNSTEILGITQDQRDKDPDSLVNRIREQPGTLGGFRYFHDHDPRILDALLADRRCAKIILTRNPLDSFVSWKIAQQTGQWKLTNVSKRKDARITFDAPEFSRHVEELQEFQILLLNRLQTTGQTAFYVAYEDLQDVQVMNGLGQWLGIQDRLEELDQSLKRQNPEPITNKVKNPDDMQRALSDIDRFNLSRTPNFEPRRGPGVPTWVGGWKAPLLYLPMRGGPEVEVASWLATLDGVSPQDLPRRMNQKHLKQWLSDHPGHRSFTVLRHPLARAHHVFCTRILPDTPEAFTQIRRKLINRHGLPIPRNGPDKDYDRDTHKAAFEGFLKFIKANLAGQTNLRIDASWSSQGQVLQGFADHLSPDHVLRENEAPRELAHLAERLGLAPEMPYSPAPDPAPFSLAEIYDDSLEAAAQDAYSKDYMSFGFGPWGDQAA